MLRFLMFNKNISAAHHHHTIANCLINTSKFSSFSRCSSGMVSEDCIQHSTIRCYCSRNSLVQDLSSSKSSSSMISFPPLVPQILSSVREVSSKSSSAKVKSKIKSHSQSSLKVTNKTTPSKNNNNLLLEIVKSELEKSPLRNLVLHTQQGGKKKNQRKQQQQQEEELCNALGREFAEKFQSSSYVSIEDRFIRLLMNASLTKGAFCPVSLEKHTPALLQGIRRQFFERSGDLNLVKIYERAVDVFRAVHRSNVLELFEVQQLQATTKDKNIKEKGTLLQLLLDELILPEGKELENERDNNNSSYLDLPRDEAEKALTPRQRLLGTILHAWYIENKNVASSSSGTSTSGSSSFESLLEKTFWLDPCKMTIVMPSSSHQTAGEGGKTPPTNSSILAVVELQLMQIIENVIRVHPNILAAVRASFPTTTVLGGGVGNVILSPDSSSLLNQRHVAPLSFSSAKSIDEQNCWVLDQAAKRSRESLVDVPLLQRKMIEWNTHDPHRVMIVGGSSGSGKTVFSLLMARTLNSSTEDDEALVSKLRASVENVIIYLVRSELVDWDEVKAAAQKETRLRDDWVESCVLKSVCERLDNSNLRFKPAALLPRDKHSVVIVFDELGAVPTFVRGLCSARLRIEKRLSEKIFGESKNDHSSSSSSSSSHSSSSHPQIRFIVAGTGLAVRADDYGDGSGQVKDLCSVLLDEHRVLIIEDVINAFVPKVFHDAPELRKLLAIERAEAELHEAMSEKKYVTEKKIDSEKEAVSIIHKKHNIKNKLMEQPFSSALKLAWGLFKNARCSTLFFRSLGQIWFKEFKPHQRFESFDCVSEQLLAGLLPVTVARYVDISGLNYYIFPENVLMCSLAVCIYKFAQLPPNPLSAESALTKWLTKHGSSGKSTEEVTLTESLLVDGGILVDCSVEKVPLTSKNKYFELSSASIVESSSDTTRLVPKETGRFLFSTAHNAMLLSLFGIARREHTWGRFEKAVFDFVTLVAAAAPYYRELKLEASRQQKSLLQRRREHHVAPNDNSVDHDTSDLSLESALFCKEAIANDSLYRLKLLLCFEDCVVHDDGKANVTSVVNLENMISFLSIKNMNNNAYPYYCFSLYMKLLLQQSCRNVKNGDSVVVMLSADREPFADIVIVGPNKVILIQCKSVRKLDNVDVRDELAKLNFVESKNNQDDKICGICAQVPRYQAQKQYLEELCRLSHVSGSTNKQIEVHAVLLISTNNSDSALPPALLTSIIDEWETGHPLIESTIAVTKKADRDCSSSSSLKIVRKTHGMCIIIPSGEYEKMSSDPMSNPLFPALLQAKVPESITVSHLANHKLI